MLRQFRKLSGVLFAAPKVCSNNLTSIQSPLMTSLMSIRTAPVPGNVIKTQKEFVPEEVIKANEFRQTIVSRVNEQIQLKSHGRLFAVVHVAGLQHRVTDEDLIIIEGYWPPNVGDKLRLEKVLLLGGSDFSLIGAPVLPRDVASVTATVIAKNMSKTKVRFRKHPRKQYERTRFVRKEQTLLRINKVEAVGFVDNDKDVIGASRKY